MPEYQDALGVNLLVEQQVIKIHCRCVHGIGRMCAVTHCFLLRCAPTCKNSAATRQSEIADSTSGRSNARMPPSDLSTFTRQFKQTIRSRHDSRRNSRRICSTILPRKSKAATAKPPESQTATINIT